MIFLLEVKEQAEVSVMERSQLEGVRPKMRWPKLKSGVYWQGALN